MKKFSVETRLDRSFCQLTTFGVGGKIKITLYPDSLRKLVRVMRLLTSLNVPTVVLGRGSNVLASDSEFDGVVVVTTKLNGAKIHGRHAYALSGTSTVYLAKLLQQKGLGGGEFLACLPATIGGALVGNAGCYGQDMAAIVVGATVLCNGKVKWLKAQQCKLSKRNSVFKQQKDYTVLAVKLKLVKSTPRDVEQRIVEMRRKKSASQPLNYPSAGCVLYHENVAVSKLLDQAGLKGYCVGGAQISNKHAGFILNVDKATSKDIYLIVQHAQNVLWENYGIRAKLELNLVNFNNSD